MRNFKKYSILNYVYSNWDIELTNTYNWWKLIWISNIWKLSKNQLSLLREYIEFSTRGKDTWYYLTEKWMQFVEDNKWFFHKIELFASDFPYIWSLILWFLWWVLALILDNLFNK